MTHEIEATLREERGKEKAKKLRKQGLIPGVFYEKGKEAIPLTFNGKDLQKFLGERHAIVEIKVKGKKRNLKAIIKDIQTNPITDEVMHVDFQGVTMSEKLTAVVPVVLVGTPKGVKLGGMLEHLIRELEVECYPKDLPEKLEIDVSDLEVGDSIHVSDLKFENLRILDDPSETIAVVEGRKVGEEGEVEEAEAPAAEMTEPEVIKKGKETEEESE